MDKILYINSLCSIDDIIPILCDQNLINYVQYSYPHISHIRILLASSILSKFPHFFNISDSLHIQSLSIWNSISSQSSIPDFDSYMSLFLAWKHSDLLSMQSYLNTTINHFKSFKESFDENEEADKQWIEGIDCSLQLMKEKKDELQKYH